ncbi:dolichyl-phosphate beta-glucosyltransferase [Streptomyces mangrovisoli]|uniref:dolichyl-phosphate beta-glucosyltransferase n=1 Tax=Streptomyces mangrovisoli TaxID=1428628 RepID=A0A1J4P4F3_9ACTN|nr:dolichyl-phosphate beta-glucosyltransferase [Streptomyces mangrovisoli]OIJ69649.1 glycosyl transferase [Streptomyces mangrovisoli]
MSAAPVRQTRQTVALSVVVPAYNEQERLGPTLDAITGYLEEHPGRWADWEIVVADDGSTDGTRDVVSGREDDRVRLVAGADHRGKGRALRLGVAATRGRRVLVTDADLAAPIEELARLDTELCADGGAAAVIGSRSVPGATIHLRQHRMRELLGRAGNFVIRAVAVPGIRDTQCGFKLFDGDRAREAFAASRLDGWGIDVEVLSHFHRADWPVAEVPVSWSHRIGSKVRPLDYARVLTELVRLKARHTLRPADLLVGLLFLAMSVGLYSGRFFDPNHRYLADSLQDQNQWEWFFAVAADSVAHLHNPFFTDLQGFPDGVNLMANTVMLGLSVPFVPVTLAFGPAVSLSLCMTLGLAVTAFAWYRLIVNRVVARRAAAFVGASLAAFAPPMVSHANAHPNFVVLFMIPLIVERALRLCAGVRVRRNGVVLGLMAAYQIFLGEEPLLLASIGMALFALGYAAARPAVARAAWRPLLKGLGLAALVCLPLVAYPLYWQFAGAQSYAAFPHSKAANSPLALISFAERSLFAGDATKAGLLASNPTEQNAFYGWPLLLVALGTAVRLWDRPQVKALALTAGGAALLSLGPTFRIPRTDVVFPGPWALFARLPLFESVIEGRVAMVCAPALGMLLALAVDRLAATRQLGTQYLGLLAVSLALLPIVPAPLRAVDREPVPAFFTSGEWKSYVHGDESLVTLPLPDAGDATALHWQTAAHLGFKLPGGYFNGPYGKDRTGIYGAAPRWTSGMLSDVRDTGVIPNIGANWRAQAAKDFAYWRAGALVVVPQSHGEQVREAVEKLVGRPGRWTGGVWVWDLHKAPSPGS